MLDTTVLKSIDKFIGTDYSRVRVGIGHPKDKRTVNNHVLEDFKEDEEEKLKEIRKYCKVNTNLNR